VLSFEVIPMPLKKTTRPVKRREKKKRSMPEAWRGEGGGEKLPEKNPAESPFGQSQREAADRFER